jgi:hypothetical protein
MVVAKWNSDLDFGYAQSGYYNQGAALDGKSGYWEFAQYARIFDYDPVLGYYVPYGVTTETGSHPASGSATYSISWRSSDNHFHAYADGAEMDGPNWNPYNTWVGGWQGQWLGETFHEQTDIFGTASSPTTFQNNQRSTSGTGSWVDTANLTLSPTDACRHHRQKTLPATNENFKIWTNPVGSTSC